MVKVRSRNLRDGFRIPTFLYGTAWKEDATQRHTALALGAGFRGIDTANQRKHYHEAGVGAAVAECGLLREELFLQTKFTHMDGQDHRLPYDPRADVATQVEQSFASSLEHLGTTYVDSYVLHGPSSATTLTEDDWAAWRAMERIAERGGARFLGVSNVSPAQLDLLLEGAAVPLTFVQNRCYARRRWDGEVRARCAEHGLVYQGFSLLTANAEVLRHPTVRRIAARLGATPAQVVFRLALALGMVPLTGTTSEAHMREDLASHDLALEADEVDELETIAVR
jgi:diketogulonate reductase-like aldo/keto reductase